MKRKQRNEKDKQKEFSRYNSKSLMSLNKYESDEFTFFELNQLPIFLREPYFYFYSTLQNNFSIDKKLLDLCAGDGIHSIQFAKMGFDVTSTDIAPNSIEIAKIRANKKQITNINFHVMDAENIDFEPNSFDIVTIIGSLSYIDLNIFINQTKKVLKPNGKIFILDSFNHNPIYRLNRYIHFLKGNRTYSTLERMPTYRTIKKLSCNFNKISVAYFGTFAFLGKFLSFLIGSQKTAILISRLDAKFNCLRRYAFKVVIEVSI